jgi:hypothetical protein
VWCGVVWNVELCEIGSFGHRTSPERDSGISNGAESWPLVRYWELHIPD